MPKRKRKRRKGSSKIQSLLFEKSKWTVSEVKRWLREHGFKTRIERGKRFWRARQLPPEENRFKRFRIKTFSKRLGIKAVIGFTRGRRA